MSSSISQFRTNTFSNNSPYNQVNFEEVEVILVHSTSTGNFVRLNRKACKVQGYGEGNLLTKSNSDILLDQEGER